MVRKIFQSQLKTVSCGALLNAQNVMERFQLFGLPVGGQPHDFVFVAKLQEAQVLRHGAVNRPRECGNAMAPSIFMRLPLPIPHMVLAKSPSPSADSSAACANGEQ